MSPFCAQAYHYLRHFPIGEEGLSPAPQEFDDPKDKGSVFRFNPDFVLFRDGFEIRVLDGEHALKTRTAWLIERMYASRGLQAYRPTADVDERLTTIVACCGEHLVGTMTLGVDTGTGLMADTLYQKEVDAVRRKGGRVCEITRLAMDPEKGSQEALAGMVQILYILVSMVHKTSDIFIEVHPRHAGYYQRLLGYELVGQERTCPRVGAPAVLLHLCAKKLDMLVKRFAGNADSSARSFYRLFPTPAALSELHRALLSS
ncbi:N-acyl amino acid synthase FeeM domain-containing protein [Thauera sinica]|uniref:N-acyl amino acid synthase FeeM catalytic core domain-containing protein n=1 Tax=Thauera sinica TaxID=2665146 RepID=A0ABW1AYW5_9RHOO|nr:hypothetical protein [Thauera sp. K11]ATE60948.1 hypothetical protein CCZ27_14255 [Thauera sp. K11]